MHLVIGLGPIGGNIGAHLAELGRKTAQIAISRQNPDATWRRGTWFGKTGYARCSRAAASSLERRRCEVACGALAHQREARMDLLRPRQRRLDVGHDVVGADMLDEFGLMEELRGLLARAT